MSLSLLDDFNVNHLSTVAKMVSMGSHLIPKETHSVVVLILLCVLAILDKSCPKFLQIEFLY